MRQEIDELYDLLETMGRQRMYAPGSVGRDHWDRALGLAALIRSCKTADEMDLIGSPVSPTTPVPAMVTLRYKDLEFSLSVEDFARTILRPSCEMIPAPE